MCVCVGGGVTRDPPPPDSPPVFIPAHLFRVASVVVPSPDAPWRP
jgi:hypothetical protein